MQESLSAFANTVLFTIAALLPIVNPVGSAPLFLSMTADLPVDARRRLATIVGRNSFLLLTAAMLVGSHILRLFGVSLPIVRVGGGLLVTAAGWKSLDAEHPDTPPNPPASDAWEREMTRRAFYPLTFPLTVGPGSISVAITLGARVASVGWGTTIDLAAQLFGVVLTALTVFLSYRFASRVIGRIGDTGSIVILRLSSFILLCVGVSILWSGIVDLVRPLLAVRR
jgi:multiple antibiotic resistance protein